VEAAHGGRGNAPSHDRSGPGGFVGGPRRGVSRHTEYRGMNISFFMEDGVYLLLLCLQS
jgi:hypothetical protein